MDYTLSKESLPAFLCSLQEEMQVVVPAENSLGATCFQEFSGQPLFLTGRTDFSPKNFMLPPKETMFAFKKKSNSYDIAPAVGEGKRVLFGVRPCDTHALQALDRVFLKQGEEDMHYRALRKNTIIIALQCREACKNGFCTSLGTAHPVSHDLLFIERGSDFFVRTETREGERIASSPFLKPAHDEPPAPDIKCNLELDTRSLAENLFSHFNHSVWEEEGKRCLSCTSCTQVCPTCYCFSTGDEFFFGSNEKSERWRERDSCHLQRFTKVAGGHVFRESRKARLRQFVLHHLSYFQKRHGTQLCVGCGRCIDACPVDISILEIANRIQQSVSGGMK